MEIDWLEDFLTLASAQVFARAADARNVSQSAFTRRIKNLEYWVGTPLFDRSVHPVVLTPAGEAFKQTALDTVKALELAREEAMGLAQRYGEVIDFVALHTLSISYFPAWIAGISRSLGVLKTRVVAENFSGCVEAVLAGNADFMLCYHHPGVPTITDDARYPSIIIAEDRLIAVSAVNADGCPKFQLSGQGEVPLLTYSPDTFLGRLTQLSIERGGLKNQFELIYQNSVAEALKTACAEGLGVAWLPYLTVQNDLAKGTLARVSTEASETMMKIKLYRSIERSRSAVERLWTFANGQSQS
ncbi:LysR family transcriptional regulator [Leisingera thetidis]|uniref:LysR family transcriptional regulator n=1 Tax=Leisingera thetidis TaxID=2930199 RepID=UPI0021F7FAB3|nr:LysR family transcriptional regulator [Leisingera thetidis]